MNGKILIVDDEQPVRHMLTRMLESSGYEVVDADSGIEGVRIEAETRPDLVITDLKMPGMDGLEMATQMLENNTERPVLMMTAYADLDSAREAVRVGIYEYFLKPMDMNDLLAGIRRALKHRELILENQTYQRDLEQKVEERTCELAQKVEHLEARDVLLQQLLSIQEPEAALGLAVKLAAGLCGATFGALYTSEDNGFVLRAAFGFGSGEKVLGASELTHLNLDGSEATVKILNLVTERKAPIALPRVDGVRSGFGMGSLGVLPVCKGDEIIAFLEVGRGQDAVVEMGDLQRLESFLPYVAMAMDDCILQESLPEWDGDVEDLLDETEKWTG